MRNKTILFLFIALTLAASAIISSRDINSIPLTQGKNQVILNLSEPIYVSALIELNPEIEAVSYKENNETVGYINIFGGIGTDFPVEAREYEIIASKSINLITPS
jgi:hypothetical protein